jgi:predicted secreted protein
MQRILLSAFLAAAAVACAPRAASPPEAPKPSPARGDLPAPLPYEAMRAIDIEDAGKTIELPVGATFVVQLVGVPTAGYLWKPVSPPAFLKVGPETGGPTTKAQLQPGFAGGSHWEVFQFTATTAGTGELVFEQRRPWETNEPPASTFKVTIKAQ